MPGGGRLPASAVAGVSTRPTHRRRGLLRELARAEHEAARERGEAIALLYASEFPIYGRFGYGSAVRQATWTVDTASTAFHAGDASSVELVSPQEARSILPAVFERHRERQVGEIRRRDFRWDDDLGLITLPWEKPWKGFVAVHRDGTGEPDGYARYTAEGKWEHRQPRGRIDVQELMALSEAAYADLWRFVADVDLVTTISAERRAPRERLPWLLTNQRAARVDEVGDGLHVRLLDVQRALAARTYAGAGRLVLEIVASPAAIEAETQRVLLDASPDGASCTDTDSEPDLSVPLAAVGAAYLGGVPLAWAAAAYGGVDEHTPGSIALADAMFRTVDEPWCSTFF